MALLPGIGIGLGSALKKALETAYKASQNKSSSGSTNHHQEVKQVQQGSKASSNTPTVTGPRNIATRDYFEDKGYEVKWNDKTGTIEVVDPRTGHSASITRGFYDTIGGTSYISPDMTKRVEETIGSGQYKLPGYSSKSTKKTYTPHEVIDLATGMIGPILGMTTPAPIAAPMTALGETVGIVGGEFAKGAYDIARSGYAPEYYMQEQLQPIYNLQEQLPKYDWNPHDTIVSKQHLYIKNTSTKH